jgi:hypothetical protein
MEVNLSKKKTIKFINGNAFDQAIPLRDSSSNVLAHILQIYLVQIFSTALFIKVNNWKQHK